MKEKLSRSDIGRKGELIALRYLLDKKYVHVDSNVRNRAGEIDLIMRDSSGDLCFVEVKTVATDISNKNFDYDPVDKLSESKISKLYKTIYHYLENRQEEKWRLDAVVVYVDISNNVARCTHYEHISREW